MIRLTREVRFSIDRDWAGRVLLSAPKSNSWGGWPSAVGIVPFLVLRATVMGEPQQPSGYLCNIRVLDDLLRTHAIPHTAECLREHGWRMPAEALLRDVWSRVVPIVPVRTPLVRLELGCTPFLRYAVTCEEPRMVYLTQQFEFSAAHRLHCESLTDAQNRELFGKCNNPNGHGHNYFLDVTVAGEVDGPLQVVLPLPRLEQVVQEAVIERLDHRHLNADVPEFAGVNPSVENIATVIWGMLVERLRPARLHSVKVFETPKTSAEYFGS